MTSPIHFFSYSAMLPVRQAVTPEAKPMHPQQSQNLTSDLFIKTTPKKAAPEPLFAARYRDGDRVLRHESDGRRCTSTAAANDPCNSGDEAEPQGFRQRARSVLSTGANVFGNALGAGVDLAEDVLDHVVEHRADLVREFGDVNADAHIALMAKAIGIEQKPNEGELPYAIKVIEIARKATPDMKAQWAKEITAAKQNEDTAAYIAKKKIPMYKIAARMAAKLEAKEEARGKTADTKYKIRQERILRALPPAYDLRRPAREARERDEWHTKRRERRDRDREGGGVAAGSSSRNDNRRYDGYYENRNDRRRD